MVRSCEPPSCAVRSKILYGFIVYCEVRFRALQGYLSKFLLNSKYALTTLYSTVHGPQLVFLALWKEKIEN